MPRGIKALSLERPSAEKIVGDLGCGRQKCSCRESARAGFGYTHCPAANHSDNKPSLDVSVRGEMVLFICRAGCAQDEVIAGLREQNLWPGGPVGKNGSRKEYDQAVEEADDLWWYEHGADAPIEEWLYTDADGLVVAKACAKKCEGRKRYWVEYIVDGTKAKTMPAYNLHLLTQYPNTPVFVVEGEKDADRLCSIGLLATTNPFGAGKWREHHTETLRGRKVVVIHDNDAPGIKHAKAVVAALSGVATAVKYVELPDVGEKGDVSDWLDQDPTRTKKDLMALVRETPVNEPDPSGSPPGVVHTSLPTLEAVSDAPLAPTDASSLSNLLDEVVAVLQRYVVFRSEHQIAALALWVVHTHAFEASSVTPYMSIYSSDPECGKSILGEVLQMLIRNGEFSSHMSGAAFARDIVGKSWVLDEMDALFSGDKDKSQLMRGVLNSGYRSSGKYVVCIGTGSNQVPTAYRTFCAKALIGIRGLPNTVQSRSIPIELERKLNTEETEDWLPDDVGDELAAIRDRLSLEITEEVVGALHGMKPHHPELHNRQREIWRPLLAIADLAGGSWPTRARAAAAQRTGQLPMGGDQSR